MTSAGPKGSFGTEQVCAFAAGLPSRQPWAFRLPLQSNLGWARWNTPYMNIPQLPGHRSKYLLSST